MPESNAADLLSCDRGSMVEGSPVRWARHGGWVLIAVAGAAGILPSSSGGSIAGPDSATWVLMGLLGICGAALLFVAAPGSPMTVTTRAQATVGGTVTGLACFALMPFAGSGAPLAGRLPAGFGWLLAGSMVVAAPWAVAAWGERRAPDQGGYGLWHLTAVAALMVFTAAVVVIRLFPDAVPDIVPASGVWQGDGSVKAVQDAHEQSAIEAVDPYVLPLVIAALLLCGEVVVTATARRRLRLTGRQQTTFVAPVEFQ